MADQYMKAVEDRSLQDARSSRTRSSQKRNHKTIQKLLKNKENVNAVDIDGNTTLMFESMYGHHENVQELIKNNADVNKVNRDGNTALMLASKNGHKKTIQELLQNKADVNIVNKDGYTALILASIEGHHDIVQELIKNNADINVGGKDGDTAMMRASLNGHHDIVQELIKNNGNVNVVNEYGNTTLMFASMKGHHDIVQELIKNKADVNKVNKDGDTALMFASMNGHHEIVQELVKNNANVNVVNKYGNTTLMFASMNGHHEIVQELIKNNADVNKVNIDGDTALIWASRSGHYHIVQKLLKNNANVNIVNKYGYTAWKLAWKSENYEIAQGLAKHNASLVNCATIPSPLVTYLKNYVEMVEKLLKYGDNIRGTLQNYTKLIWVSGKELQRIVVNFIKENDKINLVKLCKCISLICATFFAHLAITEELLKHGVFKFASLKTSSNVVEGLFTCIANLKIDVDGGNICVVMESIKKGFDNLHERMGKKYVNHSEVWISLQNHLNSMNNMIQKSINVETVNTSGYIMLSPVPSRVHLKIVEKVANYNEEDKLLKHRHTTLINSINHNYLGVLQIFEGSIAEKFVLNM